MIESKELKGLMNDCGRQYRITDFSGDSQITVETFYNFMTSYIKE